MYKILIRPLLFNLSAESAHNLAANFLKFFSLPLINSIVRLFYSGKADSVRVMNIEFPSRLGLAAGFDKNASMFRGLSALGFGFVEVGTVTPKAQPGNAKPRLFRLPADKALINRMGFNNEGVESMVKKLKGNGNGMIIGGNIGKNKVTPNEEALSDYVTCFKALHDHVDYFVVNVSSPNTPGLRELQDKGPLLKILNRLQELNREKDNPKPILLKIAPDLTNDQLLDIIDIVQTSGIEGVIATNTTISREGLNTSELEIERIGNGGLSGKPLKERSLEVVRFLREKSDKKIVIIGVGGISDSKDAQDFLDAGADLIQIYTSFIYGGPALIKEINRKIR